MSKPSFWFHCSERFHGERWVAERRTPDLVTITSEPQTPRLCVAIKRRGHCHGMHWEYIDPPKTRSTPAAVETKSPTKAVDLAKTLRGAIVPRTRKASAAGGGANKEAAHEPAPQPAEPTPAVIEASAPTPAPGVAPSDPSVPKLRVVMVEYQGYGLSDLAEQIANLVRGNKAGS